MITFSFDTVFTENSWTVSSVMAPSFHDTDPMGVVWHGNYLRVFESVREALFRAIDYGYQDMTTSGYIWPVVDVKIKYCQPWLLEEKAKVTAEIIEHENRLKIRYCVVRLSDGKTLTKSEINHMAYDIHKKEALFVSPKIFLEKLKKAS